MQKALGSSLDYTQHNDLFNKFIKAVPDDVTIVPAHLPEILEAFELGIQHVTVTRYDVNAKLAEYKSRLYLELEKNQEIIPPTEVAYIKSTLEKAYKETII